MDVFKIMKLHPGLFHCPLEVAYQLMPELTDILDELDIDRYKKWTIDVKVHMLMPNQYPCIPNWHYDMVPRDSESNQDFSKVNANNKMYLWVSGLPLTEFEDGTFIEAKKWKEFTQNDKHRGTLCTNHTWRLFIRVAPTELVPYADRTSWIRKHSQVYLDSNNFKW